MKRIAFTLLAAVLCTGQMCGVPAVQPPPAPACLTIDDVISIPPGNGRGTVFSGTYRAISIVQEECTLCTANTEPESRCDPPVVYPDQRTHFVQTDGVLAVTGDDGVTQIGSINADGGFTLGAIVTPTTTEGTRSGQGLVRVTGRFVGNRIIATYTIRMTLNEPSGSVIDLRQVNNVTYELVP